MIITQTPLRVSLLGGGTDLPEFCEAEDGCVLSVAIDSCMYVTIHDSFADEYRVAYSQVDVAPTIDGLHHDLVRAILKVHHRSCKPVEVTTTADVPSGTGLGSSSSLTVGLISALDAMRHAASDKTKHQLAEAAYSIERHCLNRPVGRQDHFAAAYGGINRFDFRAHGPTKVTTHDPRGRAGDLSANCLLLYTGRRRNAATVLDAQAEATPAKRDDLRAMARLAAEASDVLDDCDGNYLKKLGWLINEGWKLKRSLVDSISFRQADDWHAAAMENGAYGAKLLGAGGGGFLLVVAPPGAHGGIRAALGAPRELPFRVSTLGSRVVLKT